jgi:hypothetical protein
VIKARLARWPMFKALVNPIVLCWPFANKVFDVFIQTCSIGLNIVCGEVWERCADVAGIAHAIRIQGGRHETDFCATKSG